IIFMCNGDFHVDISCNPMRIDGWWTLGSFSGQPPSTLFECTSTHPITQPDGTTKYELLAFTPTMVCCAVGTQQPTEGAVLSFVFGFILQFIVMPTMFFYGLWERATSGGATFS